MNPADIRAFNGENAVSSWACRFETWDGGESRMRNRRWHFVDSVVAESITTACGKTMPVEGVEPGVPLRFADSVAMLMKCATCDRIVDRRVKADTAAQHV